MSRQSDGRRARGDRTRQATARYAAALGTVTGLRSVSISQLSAGTGLSKSGILTVFPNREAVQLAAVGEARAVFVEHVITPAWTIEPGPRRLWAFIENWFTYLSAGVFPGGCFLATTAVEFGAQQGPLAEAIRQMKSEWLALLAGELRVGRRDSAKLAREVAATVFEIDAFLSAANIGLHLMGDPAALEVGKAACKRSLARFTG